MWKYLQWKITGIFPVNKNMTPEESIDTPDNAYHNKKRSPGDIL